MIKWLKKLLREFVQQQNRDWEAYQRGTYAGFLPLALGIMGAAKLVQGALKKKGQVKAAKEAYNKQDANEQAVYDERLAAEGNKEDARLASTQGISEALAGGNRALSPAVLAAFMKRKNSAVRKRAVVDQSQGMGFDAASGVAGGIGDIAGAYIAGSNPNRVSGASRAMAPSPSDTGECPGGYPAVGGRC